MGIKKLYYTLYYPAKINRKKHDSEAKERLNNSDFSIICCDCMGGITYHNLGEQFLSPTINTMIPSDSFVKFISNLEYYLNQELCFIDNTELSPSKDSNIPIAKLDDVIIYFTHYNSREEAKEKWEKRKVRINYENIYVIFNDRGLTKEVIEQIDISKFKNVVMFTSNKDFDFPFSFFLSENEVSNINHKNILSGLRVFEEKFDYVRFLNEEKEPAEKYRITKWSK